MSRFVLGNCIDVMARIPDNAIDFILTDPPYLVGFRDRQGRPLLVIKPMNGDDGRKSPSCCSVTGGMVTGHDDVPVTQPGGAVIPAQFLHRMQP